MFKNITQGRCLSKFYHKSDGQWRETQCEHVRGGHTHRGYDNDTRLWLTWSDAEAEQSTLDFAEDRAKVHKSDKPFVGWRCWRMHITEQHTHEDGGVITASGRPPLYTDQGSVTTYKLLSTAAACTWNGPVMTTRDGLKVRSRDSIIHDRYNARDYGVYSYKTPMNLRTYFLLLAVSYPVVGRLDLTGHIVEHEIGWRAQKATVRELWVRQDLADSKEIQRQFEERYQCDVHLLPRSEVLAWAKYYSQEGSDT